MAGFGDTLQNNLGRLSDEDQQLADTIFTFLFNPSDAKIPNDVNAVLEDSFTSDPPSRYCTPGRQALTGVGNRYTMDFTYYSSALDTYRTNCRNKIGYSDLQTLDERTEELIEKSKEKFETKLEKHGFPTNGIKYGNWQAGAYLGPRHAPFHGVLNYLHYGPRQWDVLKVGEMIECALLWFRIAGQSPGGENTQTAVLSCQVAIDHNNIIQCTPHVMLSEIPTPFRMRWFDAYRRHYEKHSRDYSRDFLLVHHKLGLTIPWKFAPRETMEQTQGVVIFPNLCASEEKQVYIMDFQTRTPSDGFKEALDHVLNVFLNDLNVGKYSIDIYFPPRQTPDPTRGLMSTLAIISDRGPLVTPSDTVLPKDQLFHGGHVVGHDPFKLAEALRPKK